MEDTSFGPHQIATTGIGKLTWAYITWIFLKISLKRVYFFFSFLFSQFFIFIFIKNMFVNIYFYIIFKIKNKIIWKSIILINFSLILNLWYLIKYSYKKRKVNKDFFKLYWWSTRMYQYLYHGAQFTWIRLQNDIILILFCCFFFSSS